MHPILAQQLVHDHQASLMREARQHRLAKEASAAATARRPGSTTARLMPHVRELGRVRRAIAARLRPSPA